MAVGRKIKKGLNFFPVDVDIFQDIKIRKLIRYASGDAIAIYLCLIAKIYKNGYYLKFDKDLYFIIEEETGINEEEIRTNVEVMYNVGLLDKYMFEQYGIITSKGIQERYQYISDLSRRKSNVEKYNLIETEETPITAEEIVNNEEEKGIDSAKTTQSKVKESKVNKRKGKDTPTPLDDSEPEIKKEEKVKVLERVLLTNTEIEKLKNKFGTEAYDWMIEKLSNYKGMKGVTYKSDYSAIGVWVHEAFLKHKLETKEPVQKTSNVETVVSRIESALKKYS